MSRRTSAASKRRASVTVDPTLLGFTLGGSGAGTSSSTTTTITTSFDIHPGELIALGAARGTVSTDTNGISSISLAAGAVDGWTEAANAARGSAVDMHLFAALCTTLIPAGTVITITYTTTSARRPAMIAVFSQVTSRVAETTSGVTAGGDGGTSSGPNGNSNSPTATAGSANTTARALVIGMFSLATTTTGTPGAGYTEIAEAHTTAGSNDKGFDMEWKFVTATGTQSAGGTISTSQVWAALVATFPLTP